MKSLEEVIKEYAQKVAGIVVPETLITYSIEELNEFSQADFKAGIEFAQRWIPVEEELPTDFEKQILVKNESYNFVDLRFFNHVGQFNLLCKIHNYTHWRPISFL